MNHTRVVSIVVTAGFMAACAEGPTGDSVTEPGVGLPQQVQATPLQGKIADWVAERRARGLAAPSVSFEFSSAQGSSVFELRSKRYGPGQGYSYVAKTLIRYSGPAEAGLRRWEPLALSDQAVRKLGLPPSSLVERYVSKVAASRPGFWDRHTLGYEPRTFTITQRGTVTYPEAASLAPADVLATGTASDELVLGFSLGGRLFEEESWGFGWEGVQDVSFYVRVGAGLGLRLPIGARLDSPEPLDEGSSYSGSSWVHGVNWSPVQYTAAGVAAEDGNESYVYLEAQGCVRLSGIVDSDDCAGPNINHSQDFATPLGPGATFPLPGVSYTIADFDVAGVNLDLIPSTGSDKITALWNVSGEALGAGALEYTDAGSAATLSPIFAVDGPGHARYAVDGFRYHFTQFALTLGVTLWLDVGLPWPIPDWEEDWSRELVTFDLSGLTGAVDLSIGVHTGSAPTGLALGVEILNVAPTAAMSVAGGQHVVINGRPTVIGNVGDPFVFTGTSHDPGRDDLTLSWDWGDGAPEPDESTLYPLSGTTGPNDATDVRTHAFGSACLYVITFSSVDDDAAVSAAQALLLITDVGRAARMEGFWQHQLSRRGGNLLEPPVIDCLLASVGHVSTVFNEVRDASTTAAAFDVVNVRNNSGSEVEQFDRELLVVWLNFASGAVGYLQAVDTNQDGVADTPLHEILLSAETARRDASTGARTLRAHTAMLHRISEQFTGGVGKP